MPSTPDAEDTQTSSTSTMPERDTSAGATTRYGFSTPGLDFVDGEADHRQDLSEAQGNGGIVRDGEITGVTMEDNPDRPDTDPPVGPMWLQKLPGES